MHIENEDGKSGPELRDLIDQSAADGGIFLKDLKRYNVLEAYTKDAIYQLVVVDKERGLVAITSDGEHITEPEIWVLSGSTWGSAALKKDFVGVNMRLEIQLSDSRKTLTTMFVNTVKIREDKRLADALVKAALENQHRRRLPWHKRFYRWCKKVLSE